MFCPLTWTFPLCGRVQHFILKANPPSSAAQVRGSPVLFSPGFAAPHPTTGLRRNLFTTLWHFVLNLSSQRIVALEYWSLWDWQEVISLKQISQMFSYQPHRLSLIVYWLLSLLLFLKIVIRANICGMPTPCWMQDNVLHVHY